MMVSCVWQVFKQFQILAVTYGNIKFFTGSKRAWTINGDGTEVQLIYIYMYYMYSPSTRRPADKDT